MSLVPHCARLNELSGLSKAGLVIGGYVIAFLLAGGVVALYVSHTGGPDRDTYSSMYAFGDALLFILAFGALSLAPTGLAFVFLRRCRGFWLAWSTVAIAIAGTGMGAVAAILEPSLGTNPSIWALLAVPRIFVAPLDAALFSLSAIFAPGSRYRWYLLGAAGIECITSGFGFFHWFAPLIFN